MESNKTRIETARISLIIEKGEKVGGWNPIKQGLKLKKYLKIRKKLIRSEDESNKTRIEISEDFKNERKRVGGWNPQNKDW